MERFLHLHGLSVGYPTRKVLENIELEIEKGEILTLIGPNGAGKSTLLKSISGQLPLLAGSVLMQGQDLAKCDAKERARKMAVVLTEAVRPEYMTCREVCAAGRYPYTGRMGILCKEDEEAVDRAMARMKVEDLAERDFGAISDGQKQRVLVARALAQETPVLLMDEPTSYLDIRYRTELMETLRGLAAEGKTILMSLHEIDLALEVSDRLLCVKEGGEVFCGTPQEVLTGERIRDLFDMPSTACSAIAPSMRWGRTAAAVSATRRKASRTARDAWCPIEGRTIRSLWKNCGPFTAVDRGTWNQISRPFWKPSTARNLWRTACTGLQSRMQKWRALCGPTWTALPCRPEALAR